jgi:hypothetical protein
MTFEDKDILEIPVTVHLESVNIFQDDEEQVVIQQCYILPVDRYGSQTWCLILNDEKLQLFIKKSEKYLDLTRMKYVASFRY